MGISPHHQCGCVNDRIAFVTGLPQKAGIVMIVNEGSQKVHIRKLALVTKESALRVTSVSRNSLRN